MMDPYLSDKTVLSDSVRKELNAIYDSSLENKTSRVKYIKCVKYLRTLVYLKKIFNLNSVSSKKDS